MHAAILLLLLPIYAKFVLADQIEQSAVLPVLIQYESNPALSSTGEESTTNLVVSPRYQVSISDGINEWVFDLAIAVKRSSDVDSGSDREDPSLGFSWSRQLLHGNIMTSYDLDERSTRETELDDTGQVFVDGSRTKQALSLAYETEFSEYLSMILSTGYDQIQYSDIDLDDFSTSRVSATLRYNLGEALTPYLNLDYSLKDTVGLEDNSELYGFSVGTEWGLAENISTDTSVGINDTSESESSSGQASFSMTFSGELSQTAMTVSRGFSPSGAPGFVESNRVRASYNRTLGEYSNLGLALSWRENLNLVRNETFVLSSFYLRELGKALVLRLSAESRYIMSGDDEDAHNNIIGMSIIYSFLN